MRRLLLALFTSLLVAGTLLPASSPSASATARARTAPALRAAPTLRAASGLPSRDAWLADVRQAMEGSGRYLDRRKSWARPGAKLAMVLDIDNTSLQTHYDWPAPLIRMRGLSRHAQQLGMQVFFVTGRLRGAAVDSAKRALTHGGYKYAGVCGRKKGEGLVHSKTRCRRAIAAQGFKIVINLGNRSTDLQGPYFEKGYKLPDYGGRLS